jgi:hypothetical protein
MSCTDNFFATRKLREGEREKKRERERERERERKRKREREREIKWTEWRVGSFTFGCVDIQSQLSNYKQTTISEAQKKGKITFFVYLP